MRLNGCAVVLTFMIVSRFVSGAEYRVGYLWDIPLDNPPTSPPLMGGEGPRLTPFVFTRAIDFNGPGPGDSTLAGRFESAASSSAGSVLAASFVSCMASGDTDGDGVVGDFDFVPVGVTTTSIAEFSDFQISGPEGTTSDSLQSGVWLTLRRDSFGTLLASGSVNRFLGVRITVDGKESSGVRVFASSGSESGFGVLENPQIVAGNYVFFVPVVVPVGAAFTVALQVNAFLEGIVGQNSSIAAPQVVGLLGGSLSFGAQSANAGVGGFVFDLPAGFTASSAEAQIVENSWVGTEAGLGCEGDANLDRQVNFADLNLVLSAYGQVVTQGVGGPDLDRDGVVGFADLNLILSGFGISCGS